MNGTEKIVYECGKCHRLYYPKEIANSCCICIKCGKIESINEGLFSLCKDCRYKRDIEHEKNRFEKATKVNWEDYKGGMIYFDDNFYEDFDDLMDDLEKPIEYAWATTSRVPKLDPEDILTNLEERLEMNHDYDERDFINDTDELCDFIEEWNKKQTQKIYYPDYTIVVLAPPESIER